MIFMRSRATCAQNSRISSKERSTSIWPLTASVWWYSRRWRRRARPMPITTSSSCRTFSTSCAASCQWANDLSLSDFAKRAWSSEAVAVYREPTSLAATKSPPTVSFPASEPRAELVLPCREAYFDRLGHDGKPHRRISRLTSRSAAIGSTWRFDFRELFSRNSGESFYARSDSYCSSHPAMVLSPG
jgi:hypothetical protein